MNPKDLKYSESHEWARVEDDDVVTVGITAHAIEQLSDLVFLNLPAVGDTVEAGESFGEIESVKAVSELNSPANGEVVEVNDALQDDLSTIAQDPYGDGWLIRIRAESGAVEHLMDADAYDDLIAENA